MKALIRVILGDAARQRQEQSQRVVGDLARAVIGRVADRNSGPGGGLQIDMVEADARPHDHLAALQAIDERLVDERLVPDHQRVRVADQLLRNSAPAGAAFLEDVPVRVLSGHLPLDLRIVRILCVRCQNVKHGAQFSILFPWSMIVPVPYALPTGSRRSRMKM